MAGIGGNAPKDEVDAVDGQGLRRVFGDHRDPVVLAGAHASVELDDNARLPEGEEGGGAVRDLHIEDPVPRMVDGASVEVQDDFSDLAPGRTVVIDHLSLRTAGKSLGVADEAGGQFDDRVLEVVGLVLEAVGAEEGGEGELGGGNMRVTAGLGG